MSEGPSTLLSLPAEIRSRIFEELLSARKVRYDKGNGYSGYRFHPALFRVNRQISAEAIEAFRHQNTFVLISTPWLEAQEHVEERGQVPVVIKGHRARRFNHCRMLAEIDLAEGVPRHASKEDYTNFIISSEDVHMFCKMWQYQNLTHPGLNPHLRLNLEVQTLPAPSNPDFQSRLSKTAQANLIDPFALVKDLSSIVITGPIDEPVKEDFYRKEKLSHETAEDCLDKCERLKNEGNKTIAQQDYARARELYEKAFEAMHIPVNGRTRHVWADAYVGKRAFFHPQCGAKRGNYSIINI